MTGASRAMPTRAGTYMRKAPGWEDVAWTSTPPAMARDAELDWDAKGAYTWIAGHLELIFELTAEKLAEAGPRGRNHAYEMLRKLEERGWLTRDRYRATNGRGTVHIWTLHPAPVPSEARTFKPSNASPRRRFPAAVDTLEFPDGRELGNPELPDGRELQAVADVTAGRPASPGRPGVPSPSQHGNPARLETGRRGFRFMDETSIKEAPREEGGPASDGPPVPAVPGTSSSSSIELDENDPDTWMCRMHRENPIPPDEYRPPCGPCGRVRKSQERNTATVAAARARAEVEQAAACQLRGWCDGSLILDPLTGDHLRPLRACDHVTDPASLIAAARSGPEPAPVAAAELDARAEIARVLAARAEQRVVAKV